MTVTNFREIKKGLECAQEQNQAACREWSQGNIAAASRHMQAAHELASIVADWATSTVNELEHDLERETT